MYPGATGDVWCDMNQLAQQVKIKAITICEAMNLDFQGILIFEFFSANEALAPSAPQVQYKHSSSYTDPY